MKYWLQLDSIQLSNHTLKLSNRHKRKRPTRAVRLSGKLEQGGTRRREKKHSGRPLEVMSGQPGARLRRGGDPSRAAHQEQSPAFVTSH